jgi:hypothetical protein
MQRHRTLVSLLLGLILLVQGYAVSAAPVAQVRAAAMTGMAAMADMPCHAKMAKGSAKQMPPCCNADCPDMTTCMLGHLAVTAPASQLPPLPDVAPSSWLPPPAKLAQQSSPVFRPPITLHG